MTSGTHGRWASGGEGGVSGRAGSGTQRERGNARPGVVRLALHVKRGAEHRIALAGRPGAIDDPDVVFPARPLYGGARRQWAEGPGHDAAGKPGVADAGTDGIGKAAARERRCSCPVCWQ